MQLDQLKRWHWAIIGIVVGLCIAYVRIGVEPENLVSVSVPAFTNEVGVDDLPGKQLRIKDIVLHPPSDPKESAYGKAVQIVTFERAVYNEKRRGWEYQPAAVKVELPFQLRRNRADDYGGSFENYLKALQGDNNLVKFEYAWWEVPRTQYLLWTLGCLLVIGGIWPTIINVLVGAGFGPQKKEEDYDLSRFGKGKKTEAPVPTARRGMTTAEQGQLAKLTANLESELAPTGAARTAAAVTGTASEQPVRKLDNKPLEIAQIQEEKEDKEYKGEFYPVAKSGQKKDELP